MQSRYNVSEPRRIKFTIPLVVCIIGLTVFSCDKPRNNTENIQKEEYAVTLLRCEYYDGKKEREEEITSWYTDPGYYIFLNAPVADGAAVIVTDEFGTILGSSADGIYTLSRLPERTVRDGYMCEGFYTDENCTNRFMPGEKQYFENVTLYEKWTRLKKVVKFVNAKNDIYSRIIYSQIDDYRGDRFIPDSPGIRDLFGYRHGAKVIVYEETKVADTVDGVDDYWYQMVYRGGWLFGGDLSDHFPGPEDTRDLYPIILGLWDDEDNERIYYQFAHEIFYEKFSREMLYSEGYKETDMGLWGEWYITEAGDIIHITLTGAGNGEFEEDEYETYDVRAIVVDRDTVILEYPDGKKANLKRNYDVWSY
jgi:hypothetical protein